MFTDIAEWLKLKLRKAAEKSLSELKALPNTSETQLAAGETIRQYR